MEPTSLPVMLLYWSIAADSWRTPQFMAARAAATTKVSVSGANTFSYHSSDRRLPFQKPRAVLKVLVVSLSLRRANHSSERCGVSEGVRWAATTSDEGARRTIGAKEDDPGDTEPMVQVRVEPPTCFILGRNGNFAFGCRSWNWVIYIAVGHRLFLAVWLSWTVLSRTQTA